MSYLQITVGNAKLKFTGIFDIPAGWTCPYAVDCHAKADKETGKMIKGGEKFRCYAMSAEMYSPAARRLRWRNFDKLKGLTKNEMVALITNSLKNAGIENLKLFRIHSSGDFFNQEYFEAWLEVARKFPEITFYAYTKSLKYWVVNLGNIPTNLNLTASKGGKLDDFISKYNLKFVEVVFSVEQAGKLGLPIDNDDSHAYGSNSPFALLIHGGQPAKSEAMNAVMKLRKQGKKGYQRGSKGGGREI